MAIRTIAVAQIGIDDVGRLYVRPSESEPPLFQYIYRSGKGVSWDSSQMRFHGQVLAERSPRDWYDRIVEAVKDELGVSLKSTSATVFVGLNESDRAEILQTLA